MPESNRVVGPIFQIKGLNQFLEIPSVNRYLERISLCANFPAHQKFLQFAVEQRHFQFVGSPFALATASRVFSKGPGLASLRAQGIAVTAYLDDLLLIDQSIKDWI